MASLNSCPNCGRKAKKAFDSNWFPLSTPDIDYTYTIQPVNDLPICFTTNGLIKLNETTNDPTKWTAIGMLTNSAIKFITKAKDRESYVNGEYNINNNTVTFTINNYNNGQEHVRIGVGNFSFESSSILNITLNLDNNEKRQLKLRRK